MRPVNGIVQMVAAKKKVATIAIASFMKIPYLKMTYQVPVKQMIVQKSIE
jgi:hypothetical protein